MALADQVAARQALEKQLASAMASLSDMAKIKQEDQKTIITLNGAVLFRSDDTKLLPIAQEKLGQVAEVLKQYGDEYSITVVESGEVVVGPDYQDGSGRTYLPMLRQPVLVFESSGAKLRTVYERAVTRELRFAVFTADLFATGHDDDNRAAVRAVPSDALDLVGLALRAPHKAVDGVVRGLKRHP